MLIDSAVRPDVRKTPVWPANDVGSAGTGMNDGDTLLQEEIKQRLVRIERIKHAQLRLDRAGFSHRILIER